MRPHQNLIIRTTFCPSCLLPTPTSRLPPLLRRTASLPNKSTPTSRQTRPLTIRSTPTASSTSTSTGPLDHSLEPPDSTQALHDPSQTTTTPTATFTTLGPTSTLLSIHLSASQPLHTRRGTLLTLAANLEHITSRLSLLQPFKRAPLAAPFLFQTLSSASPASLTLASPSPNTSVVVLSLDGRTDWRVLRRNSLLAWSGSGSSLNISTHLAPKTPGLANWIAQTLTGRGLVALAARGGSYEVKLRESEEFLAHPSHIVAYSLSSTPPETYRLSHTRLRIAIPSLGQYLPDAKFVRAVRESATWRLLGRALFRIRQWLRVAVWGERVFLRFRGPGTVVLQGRHGGLVSGMRESVEEREVAGWADSSAGSVQVAVTQAARKGVNGEHGSQRTAPGSESVGKGGMKTEDNVTYASIGRDGKVAWTRE